MKEIENNPPKGTEKYVDIIEYLIKKFKHDIAIVCTKTAYSNKFFDSVINFSIEESTNKIDRVLSFFEESKQPLSEIKSITGANNPFYVKTSTRIASIAFRTIEEVVKKSQEERAVALYLQEVQQFKDLMKKCYNAVGIIDNMDTSKNFSYYFKQDREIVRKVCVDLGIINDFGGVGGGHCAITLFMILGLIAMTVSCLIM
jgi:hypothetical protein